MAVNNRTSLSAGKVIRALLLSSKEVTDITSNIFPVATDKAVLPYVLYRRASLAQLANNTRNHSDSTSIEITCFSDTYTRGLDLAEAVRGALDGEQGETDGLVMRSCMLVDGEEAWQDDAYVQQLVFEVKIL